MIDELDIPPRVTRFYGNVEFVSDMIKNRQIAFVHVSMLNDPFDPYCFFETDFGDSYLNLLKYVREKHQSDMPWFRAHITPQSWGRTVHDLKALLQTIRTTSFVLSTSAPRSDFRPRDNLYMWGHYANGHRGLAIEFDTRALARAVLMHHEAENSRPSEQNNVWAKIEYAQTFPPITAAHVYEFIKQEMELLKRRSAVRAATRLEAYYNRMTIIKSDVWQSENEWRLMWHNAEGGRKVYKCPIGEDAIVSIFLGLNISPEVAQDITSSAKKTFPGISIFQAQKRHGDLALEFSSR